MSEAPSVSLLGFEYQALIDDISKKTIGFQSTISKDCSQTDLDALLDKCRIAVDRQRVFAQIEAKSIDLRNLEEALVRGAKEIASADARNSKRAEDHEGRAGRGLSAAELKDRQSKVEALENATESLAALKNKIATLEAMIGQVAPGEHHARPNGGQELGARRGLQG